MSITRLPYFIFGWLSLALGVVGIVLPLLPTTPFVLLAAFCFSKSSTRFHNWLLNHKLFGSLVRNWQQHGVITLNAKLLATLSIVVMLSISFYFVQLPLLIMLVVISSVLMVLMFIWSRPSKPASNSASTTQTKPEPKVEGNN